MLGHLFFQNGVLALPLPLEPLSVRSSEDVAAVCGASASSSLSLLSSRARSGVCSVVLLLDLCDGVERDERVDLWEAGRELGVREEPHCASGDSMAGECVRLEQPGS